jgi:hypothetical protein
MNEIKKTISRKGETSKYRRLSECHTGRTRKETPSDILYLKYQIYRTKKEY